MHLSVDWEQVERLEVCSGETSRKKLVNLPSQSQEQLPVFTGERVPFLATQ